MAQGNYFISERNGGKYLLLEDLDLFNRSYGIVLYTRHDTFVVDSRSLRFESSIPAIFRKSKSRLYELTNDEIDTLISQVRIMMPRCSPTLSIPKIRELRELEAGLLRSGELLTPKQEIRVVAARSV